MVSRVDATVQTRLAAILRYRGYGDFAAFCHAADLAFGSAVSDEPFFCPNLLFAYQLAGLCEVSYATGAVEWWSAHASDIRVDAARIKAIGVSANWFRANESQVTSLIADVAATPLVLGTATIACNGEGGESIFAKPIDQTIPSFKDVEQQLCVEVAYEDEIPGHTEVFNPNSHQWKALDSRDDESRLIKVKKEYGGVGYFIEHPRLGLRFSVTQPEWAYIVAFHLLPWKFSTLLEITTGEVRIHRSIRLPILMYRALFAACAEVQVGPLVRFAGVAEECVRGFQRYFSVVGERP